MKAPRLLLITDDEGDMVSRLEQALAGGVRHVVLRAKGEPAQSLCARAGQLLSMLRHVNGQLLIHDRLDVALALKADGVHLPSDGLPTRLARRLLGKTPTLGRSCHSVEEARLAISQGADYVTLSPVFPTRSHPGARGMGLETFADWRAQIPGPVLALGGIQADNIHKVMHAGAYGVAIIRGILAQDNPAQVARSILGEMDGLVGHL